MLNPEKKTGRRWLGRVFVPLAIALFAALMCAGPGSVVVPATMQITAPLVCPAGATLKQNEVPGNDNGEAVVYVTLNCVGTNGASPASVTSVFGVLALIYFVIFGIATVVAVTLFVRRVSRTGGRATRPLDAEEMRQVQSRLAEGKKVEAIRLVQQATGAGLPEAKDTVETLTKE